MLDRVSIEWNRYELHYTTNYKVKKIVRIMDIEVNF